MTRIATSNRDSRSGGLFKQNKSQLLGAEDETKSASMGLMGQQRGRRYFRQG